MPERCSIPGLPYSIIHLEEIDSTNQYLRTWGREFPEDGLVVSADYQTEGRGRLGRAWNANPGEGLCFSMLISPVSLNAATRIPLMAAVVLYDTLLELEPFLDGSLELKWPNDLLINRKKVAGILTELENGEKGPFVVLGVGLNCNQKDFPRTLENATSLRLELGREVNRNKLLECFLKTWHSHFKNSATRLEDSLISDWKARSRFWNNEPVEFVIGGRKVKAQTRNLAPSGALVVLLESGEEKEIVSGEVEWIRGTAPKHK